MLEGFVRQLILGYLGRFVKDIQREQLKITLWNEEVLLENVELTLEAFDYLRLPFALKQGHVGKLSIKIPWKKLGWDPIVIIFEDVFVCASQRDDEEWSLDAVEKREFAGKKAKLAAAELGKLSKRVCHNRAGQSFISYISAKILENIQVSIRSLHVVYHDTRVDSVHTIYGLKFSSLTIMKQNPSGSSGPRVRGGQVNKTLEIIGLEVYCGMFQEPFDSMTMDLASSGEKDGDYILAPCDVSISLSVNRSGDLDINNPQHLISAEINGLEMTLDEVQLQQILNLWDYLCTSQLREKYGRYRPWCSPLSKKLKGWKILWWHYAQESVLADVRKKLKKTSWRYLGQRLSHRRKYVNLYKAKLYSLQQDQPIDANVLEELEQMEKELDVDDILSYRSTAECKLQEFLFSTSTFNINVNSGSALVDKSRNDERLTGKSRGWLNWLSLGMLGAGGTDDYSQFSGVVSDEVIKDIYEATKFHPLNTPNADAATNDKIYLCAIKFSIYHITMKLRSMKYSQEIAQLVLNGSIIECRVWEDSATIVTSINSGEMFCPCNKKLILHMARPPDVNNLIESEHPSFSVQVDASPSHDVEFLVKGLLQPVEVTYDGEFFLNFVEFFDVFNSFEFQHQRVLSSLNGINDVKSRLLSKAEFILSSRKKVIWDVCISNILINFPCGRGIMEQYNLVFEVGALLLTNKSDSGSLLSDDGKQSNDLEQLNLLSGCDISAGFQVQDLNEHFEIKINDLEMMISMPSKQISICEKFSSSITLIHCIIPDESILKQLEVYVKASSLFLHFSPSIYGAVLGLISHHNTVQPQSESVCTGTVDSLILTSNISRGPNFGVCVNAKLNSARLLVDLADDGESSLALIFVLQDLDIRYAFISSEECWICLKTLNITSSPLRGEREGHILFASGNLSLTNAAHRNDIDKWDRDKVCDFSRSFPNEGCFIFHCETINTEIACRKCIIILNDVDLHCYPHVIKLLIGFFERISSHGTSSDIENSFRSPVDADNPKKVPGFGFQSFGFSNFVESESSENASIPLDHFPFVTISNDGSLGSLESSLLYPSNDWRKYFNLRDRRIRSPKFSIKRDSENFHAHTTPSKSTSGIELNNVPGSSGDDAPSYIDFILCGIRLHFHDSSCVVGTVAMPCSNCSLFVYEDSMEVLCSLEGLILTSSWWTKNFSEFLWGPSMPNLSPIINVRVQKDGHGLSSSHIEVGFSVQHVYCILPPEYLAIIIGYFSLPDWISDSNENHIAGRNENTDAENFVSVVYKFEILDSILILPVESSECQFLKTDIKQLYCSFIGSSNSDNALKGIPPEYLVPSHMLAEKNDCLNIFGRNLFLSFLSFKDDGYGCLRLDQDTDCVNITLLAPLSADIWVRLPCESESFGMSTLATTCIMTRIAECQVLVEDEGTVFGFEALWYVIDQFSQVSDQSKCFKSDVLQFLQSTNYLKENNSAAPPIASSTVLTEVRCHIDSCLIQLYHLKEGSRELIAKAEMLFTLSASLKDDKLLALYLSFSSLALFSLPTLVVLARCNSTSLASSVLSISLLAGSQGENELHVSFPSFDVWVYLSDWVEIIDLFVSYAGLLSRSSSLYASAYISTLDKSVMSEKKEITVSLSSSSASTCSASENMKRVADILTVKLENICISFHFPIWVSNKACRELLVAQDQRNVSPNVSSHVVEGSDFKYIAVSVHSKCSELLLDGKNTRLKTTMEKWSGSIVLCEDQMVQSWPLFQIFHVFVEAEISHEMEPVHVKVDLQCDHLNMWLSHNFFYFWHGVPFVNPEEGSSQFPFDGVDFKVQIRKISFLLSDGGWSSSGPLFEILVRNILLLGNTMDNYLEGSAMGDIQVNYNNIHKVFWESFIEPWQFEINVTRKQEMSLNSSNTTDIHLRSTAQLNLNFTEPLIECVLRTIEIIKDSRGIMEPNDFPESQKFSNSPYKHIYGERYAPYVLQNLTSLPLVYHVYKGPIDDVYVSHMKGGKSLESGASDPIYIFDTPEEQIFDVWPAHFSEQQLSGVSHHFITIQLDGTSVPSVPISMDRVGLTYFEVDFYKAQDENTGHIRTDTRSGFVLPVVFDISVHRYSKLIRLYSTVMLSNATSMPLELRFDIPFGVAPKILDPIYPGQELPLPLHLAESGRLRWRPIGNAYLWSEVYNLSNLLSQETKVGFLKSFVCYPAHPSSDPFRCCVSVRNISLSVPKNCSTNVSGQRLQKLDESKRLVHQLTLSTPLVVKNYLPKEMSLAIESGGVIHSAFLSEVETSFHHIDPSHDLGLELLVDEFKQASLKFPRTETFFTMAKFSGTKFTLSEIVAFEPDSSNGPVYVTVEKIMDAFSGARELSFFVPYLLYNCIGFPLLISESGKEMNRVGGIIPSSYDLSEKELHQIKKDGLSLVSCVDSSHAVDSHGTECPPNHVISSRDSVYPRNQWPLYNSLISSNAKGNDHESSSTNYSGIRNASSNRSKDKLSCTGGELTPRKSNFMGYEHGKVRAYMYSPVPFSATNEIMVRVSRAQYANVTENMPNLLWSSPFLLVPPSGSTTVLVPQSSPNAAYMISVTSNAVAGPLTGRASAITFQPRYVICNACSRDLCYKQKGTDFISRLGIGEHSHLQWIDTTRELLISIRYNEPGWQWSGSFLPDHLGDTQVKMRNYVSGSSCIIRVEVQNADVSSGDEKVVGSLHGNSGTNLILLSDDDTGYMPYRVENFSKERLRIFQQKCESFDTIVHSYTSHPYAWDEPCYPHRLTVEVPGEHVLGSYSLDDVKEYLPVYIPSSSEKPKRKLVVSVLAEGATKVLRVIDSNYHTMDDVPHLREKRKHEQKQDKVSGYKEKISIKIPYLGISLINIQAQELLFVFAKNITVDLLQSLDQQKLCFQISSLQIDNQLRSSPYPVMLSFDSEYRSNQAGQMRSKDDGTKSTKDKILQRTSDSSYEPVFYFAVSKWRKKDISLVSFDYISLRAADFHLELEQEVILSLFDFIRNVTSRFHSDVLQLVESSSHGLTSEYQQASGGENYLMNVPLLSDNYKYNLSLPSIVPIGAPWQQIYLLARRQKKIYVEVFELSPINLTLSFSSAPWMLRHGILTSGESLIHRGLMALADVEGAQIHLKQLTISHHMGSWESIQEILIRHCTRQLLHEMYKVFGSAGVIGNPMGFARTLGLGIRDFLAVPARTFFQSPTGLITGMAQGTTSLLSNTVYAISDAATQFSKAAHKGIVAFTFDDQTISRIEQQQMGAASQTKGVINEVLEGLTGLLQSPIQGAEKHGLPGVLSGIALGVTGLVAKPAASILQVAGKTAQSIRNRSRLYQMGRQRFRVRLPRPISREVPLRPYSWEEAVGASVLIEADEGLRLKDEVLVTCKALKQAGKFVIITERLVLIVSCPGLADLGKPEFRGVPPDLEWTVESEISLESVMHADTDQGLVHIVGSSSETFSRQNKQGKRGVGSRTSRWSSPTLPLTQTNLELRHREDAENLLQILLSTIERGKDQGWGCRNLLHRSSIK
ncbi:hypothetical protein UlMin_023774 [Ulmus minor]